MSKKNTIIDRFAGKGVYPHQLAWVLLIPFRNLYLSPKKLIKRMKLKDDFVVLELGCGPGYFSPSVARAIPNGTLYLADIQSEMLEKAKNRLNKKHVKNVEFVKVDGKRLPFDEGFFDLIYLVTVLGEISEQKAYVKDMYRILKSGGVLSISEQAGDPDSLPLKTVRGLLESEGFVFEEVFGKGRTYTANFKKHNVYNMETFIRKAKESEFDLVLKLLAQLWPGKELNKNNLKKVYKNIINSEDEEALCAIIDDRIVGFCTILMHDSLWQESKIAHIGELIVDKSFRGKMIGTSLLEKSFEIAKNKGCKKIELDSAFHREKAHKFYEKLGFENRAYLFSKDLF